MKNIFVGNLKFNATEESVRSLFAQYGVVTSARIMTDRDTGRSRGFAFVEMENENEADQAARSDRQQVLCRQHRMDPGKSLRNQLPRSVAVGKPARFQASSPPSRMKASHSAAAASRPAFAPVRAPDRQWKIST